MTNPPKSPLWIFLQPETIWTTRCCLWFTSLTLVFFSPRQLWPHPGLAKHRERPSLPRSVVAGVNRAAVPPHSHALLAGVSLCYTTPEGESYIKVQTSRKCPLASVCRYCKMLGLSEQLRELVVLTLGQGGKSWKRTVYIYKLCSEADLSVFRG